LGIIEFPNSADSQKFFRFSRLDDGRRSRQSEAGRVEYVQKKKYFPRTRRVGSMSGAISEENGDDARRILNLAGGVNFRDLGGYKTQDGRSVRWGMLYRSGSMGHLTEPDHAILSGLNIGGVHDLRTREEREREPNRWAQAAGIPYWSRDYVSGFGVLREMLTAELPDPAAAFEVMQQGYRRLPFEHAPAYQALFERLRDGEVPMVFNCSAGKDRAGTAAALVLTLLGVKRETVVEDYRLTDRVLADRAANLLRSAGALGKVSEDVWAVVMRTDARYIQCAFDSIEERHGSIEGYFHEALHIDTAGIETIRDRLLE
jgi:protein-tyrosine phosphatase